MPPVSSTMLSLGTLAPDFTLPDAVSGESVARGHAGEPLLVMFICSHCPFVKHVQHELARIGQDYADRGIRIVAISSNDPAIAPDDSPEGLKAQAETVGFNFPYLFDESQAVGKAYQAACTPDFFLFDRHLHLVYRGQLDDSRPGNHKPVTGRDLRAALDAVAAGRPVSAEQHPSVGCSIKWRS